MSWLCCCQCVDQSDVALVHRCGKFNRTANPGCLCLWPCCCETVAGTISLRMQTLEVSCETKTNDNVFITLVTSVQYQAIEANCVETFYKVSSPHDTIRAHIEDVVRSTVPVINLDDVFEQKDHIAKKVGEHLSTAMLEYGFSVTKALVTDIMPDERVKESMNAINAAKRLRIAASDEADADKIRVVKAAEAEAEKNYLEGKGIAKKRKEVMRGLKESVADFEKEVSGTTPSEVLNMVMMSQYFDMLKEVGTNSGNSTIFIPHVPGAITGTMTDIQQALAQSQMEAGAANTYASNNVISPGARTTASTAYGTTAP